MERGEALRDALLASTPARWVGDTLERRPHMSSLTLAVGGPVKDGFWVRVLTLLAQVRLEIAVHL